MLTNQELQQLANAHTGGDLETVCWEAEAEIKELRKKLKDIRKLMAETERRLAEGECGTDDLIALSKKVTRIVDR